MTLLRRVLTGCGTLPPSPLLKTVRGVVAPRCKICSRDNYIERCINRAPDSASAAGYTHVARYSGDMIGSVNGEIMTLRFARDCLADRFVSRRGTISSRWQNHAAFNPPPPLSSACGLPPTFAPSPLGARTAAREKVARTAGPRSSPPGSAAPGAPSARPSNRSAARSRTARTRRPMRLRPHPESKPPAVTDAVNHADIAHTRTFGTDSKCMSNSGRNVYRALQSCGAPTASRNLICASRRGRR
jgi:hypothetical protein